MTETRHDVFLEWLSERASGTWETFRDAHAWLFGDLAVGASLRSPTWTASLLIALGHLEVDWEAGKWSITAPCLVGLPSAGSTAVLTGRRPSRLLAAIRQSAEDEAFNDLDLSEYEPREGPTVIYLQYGSPQVIDEFAGTLGITFEPYPAERLSRLLPKLDDILRDCPVTPAPPAGYVVERFDPGRLSWDLAATGTDRGLYRYRAYWSDRYRLFTGGVYREVDRDIGVWAALADHGVSVLRFDRSNVNGTLVLPAAVRLPGVFARAAVLCSGLPPLVDTTTRLVRYENVPQAIAARIAAALDQDLDTKIAAGGDA